MSKEIIKEVRKEVSNLKADNDVSQIREDLNNLKQDASSLIRHSKESAQEQLALSEEKARRAYETAKETGKDYYSEAEAYVRNNPGQSLAAAFIGGILASMLFRSGR